MHQQNAEKRRPETSPGTEIEAVEAEGSEATDAEIEGSDATDAKAKRG